MKVLHLVAVVSVLFLESIFGCSLCHSAGNLAGILRNDLAGQVPTNVGPRLYDIISGLPPALAVPALAGGIFPGNALIARYPQQVIKIQGHLRQDGHYGHPNHTPGILHTGEVNHSQPSPLHSILLYRYGRLVLQKQIELQVG